MMDRYEQQLKINRVKYEKEKTALCKEFDDTTKRLAGKIQSQFLMDKTVCILQKWLEVLV